MFILPSCHCNSKSSHSTAKALLILALGSMEYESLREGMKGPKKTCTKFTDKERWKRSPNSNKKNVCLKHGRLLMLETIDVKAQSFLQIIRRKGGVVNTVVAIATAKVLIAQSDQQHLKVLDLDSLSWAKRLFQRMVLLVSQNYFKAEIPERAKSEAALIPHHQIVDLVEKHHIPSSMVINIDQTPSKYAPVSNQTLPKKKDQIMLPFTDPHTNRQ